MKKSFAYNQQIVPDSLLVSNSFYKFAHEKDENENYLLKSSPALALKS